MLRLRAAVVCVRGMVKESNMSRKGRKKLYLLIFKSIIPVMNPSDRLDILGKNLRMARKQTFPRDNLQAFATRIGVSRATLQRMEKGDLSVSLGKYYRAAEILGLSTPFLSLLQPRRSLFDD